MQPQTVLFLPTENPLLAYEVLRWKEEMLKEELPQSPTCVIEHASPCFSGNLRLWRLSHRT